MTKQKKIYVLVWDDGDAVGVGDSVLAFDVKKRAIEEAVAENAAPVVDPSWGACRVYEVTKMRKVGK